VGPRAVKTCWARVFWFNPVDDELCWTPEDDPEENPLAWDKELIKDCWSTDEDCPEERAPFTDCVMVGVSIEIIWDTRADASCLLEPLT